MSNDKKPKPTKPDQQPSPAKRAADLKKTSDAEREIYQAEPQIKSISASEGVPRSHPSYKLSSKPIRPTETAQDAKPEPPPKSDD